MLNFLGVSHNFSVLAETTWSSTFLFTDEVTQAAADLDSVTFEGWVMVHGAKREIRFSRASADEMQHMVQVTLPKLPQGRWSFEIFCAQESGEKSRMIYGYISAEGGLDSDTGRTYANRTLEVRLPGDETQRIALEWRATTAAAQAVEEARKILAEVRETGGKIDEVNGKLDRLDEAVDAAESARDEAQEIVDNAPREYIPDISDDGYWIINGEKTTKKAIGTDGLNGADAITVVRHKISDVSELPQEGETCSSGHIYYIQTIDEVATATIALPDNFTAAETVALSINGVEVTADVTTAADADGVLTAILAAVQGAAIPGVTAEMGENCIILTGDDEAVTVASPTLEVQETPRHIWDGCPCYVWCFDENNSGSWARVDSDGMMTAGTAGAGNGYGGGSVKEATAEEPGTVRLGTNEVFFGDTTPVGKDKHGRLAVCITLGTATYTEPGFVRLGSAFGAKNKEPYLLSITADDSARLCQNIAPGGALKHMQHGGWEDCAVLGLRMNSMTSDDFYLGLHTSSSFTQSEDKGLELNPATASQIGGVFLADDLNDLRPGRILDTISLKALLGLQFPSKKDMDKELLNFIRTNDTLMSIQVLTQEQYDALAAPDAHTLYLVY